MKKIIGIVGMYFLLYLMLFIIMPNTDYPLYGNEGTLIIAIFTTLIVLIGMIFITDKLSTWYIVLILYIFLITIHHPQKGQYNIGTWGLLGSSYLAPELAWIGITLVLIQTMFWTFITWACIKIFKKLYYKK